MCDINQIEFNEQFQKAYHLMEYSNKNVFITGKAGTGKSTLLKYFREKTKKKAVFLAPTGISAVNINGQTIHSFFNFKPDITYEKAGKLKPIDEKIYKELDTIVIDEVSMVRADIIDCIDVFLKKNGPNKNQPFGGIQMILIGDLYQLPPVVTKKEKELFSKVYESPYFFDALVFKKSLEKLVFDFEKKKLSKESMGFKMEFIELEKIYRQIDEKFISILNSIRNNTVTEEQISLLNERYIPDFKEPADENYIFLVPTNDLAQKINFEKLNKLKGDFYSYKGEVKGDFPLSDLPTSLELVFKIGSQVMLLNNDTYGRWINGTIGVIEEVLEDKNFGSDIIVVKLQNGEAVEVTPFEWQMFNFHFDYERKQIISSPAGSFTQYPIKLAWAVTIHKSQGMTFDRVIIDTGKGMFSHGQLYVALSRCRTLKGIILKKPISKKHILMDSRIVDFVTNYQYKCSEENCPIHKKIEIIQDAIKKNKKLQIVYLKTTDEKSRREVIPTFVGELEYNGKKFIGLEAFCDYRKEERVFRLDRILEIREIE